MIYVDLFDKILYTFKIDGEDKDIVIKDITKNIRFLKKFIDSIPNRYSYKIKDGERLDVISEIHYNNPNYDWVLMIANGIYDIYEDMPLTNDEFSTFLSNKYGKRINDAHHYIDSRGTISDARIALKTDFADSVKVGSLVKKTTSFDVYSGVVEKIVGDTLIVNFNRGNFRENDVVTISYYDKKNNKVVNTSNTATITDSKLFVEYSIVTNAEFEYIENEKKRNIKIVPFEYIPQIVNEFKKIINE